MKALLVALSVCAVALPAQAQHPRSPALLQDAVTPTKAITSFGDAALAVWGATDRLLGSRSDGRGLAWDTPTRLDTAPHRYATGTVPSVRLLGLEASDDGSQVALLWVEENAEPGPFQLDTFGEPFFGLSTDGGQTFTEIALDKGRPQDTGRVNLGVLAQSPDGLHVYAFFRTFLDTQGIDQGGEEKLFLVASHDGGTSFSSAVEVVPQVVSGSPFFTLENIALVADGLTVDAYYHDQGPLVPGLFQVRSLDGGASFQPAVFRADGLISRVTARDDLHVLLALEGQDIVTRVSTDGGATFAPSVTASTITNALLDMEHGITPSGNIVLAWIDDRTGDYRVYSSTSTDGGTTYSSELELMPARVANLAVVVPPRADDPDSVVISWQGLNALEPGRAALSTDGGQTFGATANVIEDLATGTAGQAWTYNTLYDNYLALANRDDGDEELVVGGFRPQSVRAEGFVQNGLARFHVEHFDEPGFVLCWVALSHAPGSFPLTFAGDPRNLGLDPSSSLFRHSLRNLSSFLAVVSNGAGTTPDIPFPLPPGFTFYAVAETFALSPLRKGQLSDVLEIVGQ